MIYNTIQYVVDNGIGTLTFNRPTVANGFNIEMCKEILEVLDKAHNDESVRALLINAEGKVFSAGRFLLKPDSSGAVRAARCVWR